MAKFKVKREEIDKYFGLPMGKQYVFPPVLELEGELVEDKRSHAEEDFINCVEHGRYCGACWIDGCPHPTHYCESDKPSVELPRELPEFDLDTEEERDQYASISINRRAINQLIRYLHAKGI